MATQNEGQGDGEADIGLTESDLRDRIDNEAPERIKETLGYIERLPQTTYLLLELPTSGKGIDIYAPKKAVEKLKNMLNQVGIRVVRDHEITIPDIYTVADTIETAVLNAEDFARYSLGAPDDLIQYAKESVREGINSQLSPHLTKPRIINNLFLDTLVRTYASQGPK